MAETFLSRRGGPPGNTAVPAAGKEPAAPVGAPASGPPDSPCQGPEGSSAAWSSEGWPPRVVVTEPTLRGAGRRSSLPTANGNALRQTAVHHRGTVKVDQQSHRRSAGS